MANRASRPPSDFAAQLIAAIEDAQAAASQQKPATQLAQAAWDKLQYDFPVSEDYTFVEGSCCAMHGLCNRFHGCRCRRRSPVLIEQERVDQTCR
jgi:hypothetical protein